MQVDSMITNCIKLLLMDRKDFIRTSTLAGSQQLLERVQLFPRTEFS
jgi:hypothetical protein